MCDESSILYIIHLLKMSMVRNVKGMALAQHARVWRNVKSKRTCVWQYTRPNSLGISYALSSNACESGNVPNPTPPCLATR